MAPTNRETPAIPDTAIVIMPMILPKVSSISVWVVMVKSSSSRWRSISTRRIASTTSGMTSVSLAITSICDQFIPIEEIQGGGDRNIDHVIEVKAHHLALGLHHADDEKVAPPIRTRFPSGDLSS